MGLRERILSELNSEKETIRLGKSRHKFKRVFKTNVTLKTKLSIKVSFQRRNLAEAS